MRRSIILFLTALSMGAFANPITSTGQLIDSHLDTRSIDTDVPLLSDPGYLAAWESVTGTVPANAVGNTENAKRTIGPIDGNNNYVSLFYRKGRFVVSLVLVSDIRGGLKDGLTGTAEVASAVARNARHVMGTATGKWASTSWAFYSGIQSSQGFTIVAKNLMPKSVQDYKDALRAATALAESYGMTAPVYWIYPQNNKRDDNVSDIHNFSILAEFTPSVALADYLFNAFHNVNHTASTGNANENLLSKRDGYCSDYNEKERMIKNWAPWNTQYDVGCIGLLSDFDQD